MGSACSQYEVRLEDLLDAGEEFAADAELSAHLEGCAGCREMLEAARLARGLLRDGLEPAPGPGGAFITRVLAGIRAEENRRQQFWRPLEALASRLALTAAALLLVLSAYVWEYGPSSTRRQPVSSNQSQVSDGFPEPASQPADKDEILLTLAESRRGR